MLCEHGHEAEQCGGCGWAELLERFEVYHARRPQVTDQGRADVARLRLLNERSRRVRGPRRPSWW